jgi:hypothetical protein
MCDCGDYCEYCHLELVYGHDEMMRVMLDTIRPGHKVTILVHKGIGRNGVEWRERTGRAVMPGPAGWVLNMGGRYGTPAVATIDNLVRVETKGGSVGRP